MLFQTNRLIKKSWRYLQSHKYLNGFESIEEFEEEFERLEEVDGDGSRAFVSRRSTEALFEPGNLRLTNVESESDFEEITSPAISGGEE